MENIIILLTGFNIFLLIKVVNLDFKLDQLKKKVDDLHKSKFY